MVEIGVIYEGGVDRLETEGIQGGGGQGKNSGITHSRGWTA